MVFYREDGDHLATTGAVCTLSGRPAHSAWVVAIVPLEKLKVLNEHEAMSFPEVNGRLAAGAPQKSFHCAIDEITALYVRLHLTL